MKYRSLLLVVMLLLSVGMPLMAQDEMAEPDLRIGILPVLNTLPTHLAVWLDYFTEEGISVELTGYDSAAELTMDVAAGELDGFQADVISTLKLNAAGADLRVVRHVEFTNMPFVALITLPLIGIENLEELAGKKIAISENTIIHYLSDTILTQAGINVDEVEYVNVPTILERGNLLMMGQIDAAFTPEPIVQFTVNLFDGKVLVDDSVLDHPPPEAIVFTASALAEKGDAVRAFLSAFERAVNTNNEFGGDPARYLEFRERQGGSTTAVSELAEIQELFLLVIENIETLPIFNRASVTSEASFAHIQDWALDVGLVMEARAYEDVIDGSFLPEMMEDEMDMDDDMGDMSEEDGE